MSCNNYWYGAPSTNNVSYYNTIARNQRTEFDNNMQLKWNRGPSPLKEGYCSSGSYGNTPGSIGQQVISVQDPDNQWSYRAYYI
jgi:hypothetical protein